MSPAKFAYRLTEALSSVVGLTSEPVLAGVGIAWPSAIGLHGELMESHDHHAEFNAPGFLLGPLVGRAVEEAGFRGARTDDGNVLPIPVDVVNDADADLLYEARWGVAAGASSALGIKLCGGVGGSILINGSIWSGHNGRAGEIEHTPVRPKETQLKEEWKGLTDLDALDPCVCLRPNCVGRFASGRAIIDTLADFAPKSADYNERGRLIEAGSKDREQDVFHRVGELLAQALHGPVLAFDPEFIVLTAFPYNESLVSGLADALVNGTGIHIKATKVVGGTRGVQTTAAGAGRFVIEQRILPRIEQAILHKAEPTLRRDLPAWLRRLVPACHQGDLLEFIPLYRP